MESISHHTDEINGIIFRYTQSGVSDNVLVLLPGTLGDEYLFDKIQVSFSKNYRILVFNHLNIVDFDEQIVLYHQVLTEKLKLTAFHIGGSSVGGWIAQYYTMKYPKYVKSLVIGNSFADNTLLRNQSLGIYKISKYVPWFIFKRVFQKSIVSSLEGYDPEIRHYFLRSLNTIGKSFLRRKFWWSLAIREELELDPSIPKLIIYTRDDSVVSFEVTKHLIEFYPEAKVRRIDTGNHYPYKTNPDEYKDVILSFLQTIEI